MQLDENEEDLRGQQNNMQQVVGGGVGQEGSNGTSQDESNIYEMNFTQLCEVN